METNLEKAKRLFYKGIKDYPEMTMDRQGFVIGLLKVAATPDAINNLSLGGVTKRLFHFDYIEKVKVIGGHRMGSMQVEEILAYDEEHAICLFKQEHGDTPFDPPY